MLRNPKKEFPKSLVVKCRVNPAQREAIEAFCRKHGVTLSEYMRASLSVEPLHLPANMAAISELRRQGGLLKHIQNESNGKYNSAILDVLSALKKCIDLLAQTHVAELDRMRADLMSKMAGD